MRSGHKHPLGISVVATTEKEGEHSMFIIVSVYLFCVFRMLEDSERRRVTDPRVRWMCHMKFQTTLCDRRNSKT